VAWAIITLVALLAGSVVLAVWMAVIAALAAATTSRSWTAPPPPGGEGEAAAPEADPRRTTMMAAGGAAVITLAAAAGPLAAAGAVVVVAILVTLLALSSGARPAPGPVRGVLVVVAPAVAASSLVVARTQGLDQGLVLAGMISVYDSAAFLIGTGASNAWEGPIAGIASTGALTLFLAGALLLPFRGNGVWVLGGIVAVLAPLGPSVARRLVADRSARVPALRRLDTLLLAGPVWVVAASRLLHG